MAQSLRKFVSRAPRYVLRPEDRKMMRFAPKGETNQSYSTELVNLSETGMAIVVDSDSAPQLGDKIKVEFEIPGKEQIAWHAKVVRVHEKETAWWSNEDPDSSSEIVIGLKFIELPQGHAIAIRQGLEHQYSKSKKERGRLVRKQSVQYFLEHKKQFALLFACTLVSIAILYLLSLPFGNYFPKIGSPWGARDFNVHKFNSPENK